jgi:hypothetical protein
MAYVVGSVSVEVVPDFRNAQNAITAWFKAQPDSLKVPVRPDIDPRSVATVERQAHEVGDKVGKAIAEGVEKRVASGQTSALARQVAKLEKDIEKARVTERDATDKLKIAETRLDEARKAGNRSASTLMNLEAAVERQRRRITESNIAGARAVDELTVARRALAQETATAVAKAERDSLRAARRQETAELRSLMEAARIAREREAIREADARLAQEHREEESRREVESIRKTGDRVAREMAAARRKADLEVMRQAERDAKTFERMAVDDARRASKALEAAIRENEKIKIQIEIDEEKARASGRTAGNLVTRAINAEIHQNAGLISAVIGGALLAGAPALSAAAVALFSGFSAVAAAQSQEVRTAWLGTWEEIRNGATEDARIIAPAYERMAAAIAQSFQRMRPEIRDALQASEAQVDSFTMSLTETAETAIPALLRAVQGGLPIVTGFGNLLEGTGRGFADFFDTITEKAPTSGRVLSLLGGTTEELLGLLGELTAAGAELATSVLPLLNGGLGLLNGTANLLGTSLSSIGAGFFAFQAAQGAGRMMQGLSNRLGTAALQGGRFADSLGKAADISHRVAGTLPVVGAALALVAYGLEDSQQKLNTWTDAILAGGNAAREAQAQAIEAHKNDETAIAEFLNLAPDWEDAKKAADDYLASLDPLTRAQVELERATNNLKMVQGDSSATAADLAAAQGEVDRWSRNAADAQAALETATRGVTDAMVAQADGARALTDARFAQAKAVDDLQTAQSDYKAALADEASSAEDIRDALFKVQEGYNKVGDAAYKVAFQALPASMDAKQKDIIASQAQLDALLALREEHGNLGPILEEEIIRLQGITAGADDAMLAQAALAGAFEQLGIAVNTVPGEKSITISDNNTTPDLIDRLRDLGFTVVELPDNKGIEVSAVTDEAKGNLDNLAGLLADLDADLATPEVDLDPGLFNAVYDQVNDLLSGLGQEVVAPTLDLETEPFNVHENYASGALEFLDKQRPTPIADLDTGPHEDGISDATSLNDFLNDQNPTPDADLDPTDFNRRNADVMTLLGILDRSSADPDAILNDFASDAISRIATGLNGLDGRNVTSTATLITINRQYNEVINTVRGIFGAGATGGALEDIVARYRPQKMAVGGRPRSWGAIQGPGGPTDDRVPILGSNGEHMLDARDVQLMGGQQAVYAFRDALNRGIIGARARDTSVRNVVAAIGDGGREVNQSVAGFVNNGTVNVVSEREMMRQAEQRRREALAAIGV